MMHYPDDAVEDTCKIHLKHGEDATKLAIIALCKRTLPGWSGLPEESIEMSSISGGISNILVKLAPSASSTLRPVAVKVFGDKTEIIIDREQEKKVLVALNKAGFGAKVLALFGNGRIEEFLSCKTLTPEEMCQPYYSHRIARRLAQFHGASVPIAREPMLFPTIWQWLATARGLIFDRPDQQELADKLDFDQMEDELAETQAACLTLESPVVFCHNDLLAGNVLILQEDGYQGESGPLQFIDFEYSTYSFRGFDFGNHFNEYAGFECDYDRYPSKSHQLEFFRHYLEGNGTCSSSCSQDMLEKMVVEANAFALVSHIYWGVWALVQAKYSPIDFDYLGYSKLRWDEYFRKKSEFLDKVEVPVRRYSLTS